jgi:hypothetical protein
MDADDADDANDGAAANVADDAVDADDGAAANVDNDVDANVAAKKVLDPWREHPLRAFLWDELSNYNIPTNVNEMGPKEVWDTYCDREDTAHSFEDFFFGAEFKRRLASLRKIMAESLDCAAMDQLAFDAHRKHFPYQEFDANGNRNWYGSAAEDLLDEDLAAGLYPAMKPKELYMLRPAYQEFSLEVFRGHIHQGIGTAKYLYTLKFREEEKKAERQEKKDKKQAAIDRKAAKAAAKEADKIAKAAAKEADKAAKEADKIAKAAAKAAAKAVAAAAKAAAAAAKKAGKKAGK